MGRTERKKFKEFSLIGNYCGWKNSLCVNFSDGCRCCGRNLKRLTEIDRKFWKIQEVLRNSREKIQTEICFVIEIPYKLWDALKLFPRNFDF